MDQLLEENILAEETNLPYQERSGHQEKAKKIDQYIIKEKELFEARCRALSGI